MAGFTTRPEIRGTFGVVASTHWLASAVGMSVLEKGGNAFDAAAAAGFTLQVVEPSTNGPLGEAPMLVWSEANRRCDMICGQGVAPAAATIAKFRELGLDIIPGTGLLAAAVPAAFGAWMRLLRDYGTMPLAEIDGPLGLPPLMVRLNCLIPVARALSVTCTVKVNVPGAVGVPVSNAVRTPPRVVSEIPCGRFPVMTFQLAYGVVPPVASSACEYGDPTFPPGSGEAVMIVGPFSGVLRKLGRN